jgi:hypothetical protein
MSWIEVKEARRAELEGRAERIADGKAQHRAPIPLLDVYDHRSRA